jgi:hypothetical protein
VGGDSCRGAGGDESEDGGEDEDEGVEEVEEGVEEVEEGVEVGVEAEGTPTLETLAVICFIEAFVCINSNNTLNFLEAIRMVSSLFRIVSMLRL